MGQLAGRPGTRGRWCEWRLVGKASDARRHGQGAVRTVAAVATTGEGPAAGARSSHDGQRRSELTAVAGGLPPLLSHRDRAPLRGSHLPWAGRLPMPPSPGSSPPRWSCSSEKLPDEGHDLRAIELVSPCDHSTDSERMGQQKAVGRLEQEYVVAPQWLELSISSLYPPRPQACHRQLAFGCSPWAHTQVDHNSNHARVVT
ncbi:unnamed protein product [Urochloa humidicola]